MSQYIINAYSASIEAEKNKQINRPNDTVRVFENKICSSERGTKVRKQKSKR